MTTCGACGGPCLAPDGQPSDEGAHVCKLKDLDPEHVVQLHSALSCPHVFCWLNGGRMSGASLTHRLIDRNGR